MDYKISITPTLHLADKIRVTSPYADLTQFESGPQASVGYPGANARTAKHAPITDISFLRRSTTYTS